ncbi:NAD(P)-binding protein [Pluteus cervinus]|uniref:NAD(P)-binding protein n=1 Tax=Pluteus cervinus TaxID=181527 RepID=A0ACD3B250_9AGAR|nr:NAD(P)-binding protein [Pluteus cervinus]
MALKVVITGASGVLGSAVFRAFKEAQTFDVIGLAFSKKGEGLINIDLINKEEVDKLFDSTRPDWVIHCAAERRPDVAEKDPDGAKKLNADVPAHLAACAKHHQFKLVYISTDYVFDGTSPPYKPDSVTNPLQLYGRSKREGEIGVLGIDEADVVVLRVPVLYGPSPQNSDSAVNVLLDVVLDQSGKAYKMDHYATRYPTNIIDIANFLVRLTSLKRPIPKILHYSGAEPYTKYEMCLIFAKILGLPHSHIIPDADPPKGEGATTRPRDCQLDTTATEELGVEGGLGQSLFDEWWTSHLTSSSRSTA